MALTLSTEDLDAIDELITAALVAIKAKTDTLGAASIVVSSPVAEDGTTLTVYAGDSYPLVHGRSGISIDIADAAHAFELTTNCVVKLKAAQMTWTAASVTSTTAGWTIRWTPTAAQTALVTGAQSYEVEATYTEIPPPNNTSTLATGMLVCVRDIPAVV